MCLESLPHTPLRARPLLVVELSAITANTSGVLALQSTGNSVSVGAPNPSGTARGAQTSVVCWRFRAIADCHGDTTSSVRRPTTNCCNGVTAKIRIEPDLNRLGVAYRDVLVQVLHQPIGLLQTGHLQEPC